jgi:hypothetical protein
MRKGINLLRNLEKVMRLVSSMGTTNMRIGIIHLVNMGRDSVLATLNPREANMNPRKMAPLSPRKIFAG